MTPRNISDYALIGDCETAALVSKHGSIDWLCLPRFDSPACFAALVATQENGFWQISPEGNFRVTRRYRPHTLILETEFRTSRGTALLTDFMPLRAARPTIIRIIRGIRGNIRMQMELVIRFDYGLTVPWVTRQRDGTLSAIAGPHQLRFKSPVALEGKDLRTCSEFSVRAGQRVQFELSYESSSQAAGTLRNHRRALKNTEASWHAWASQCTYRGKLSEAVERSLIILKALTYAPTGGMIAAPTTSLPEVPAGSRNWDYRFCWIRDATFTMLGLIHAGYFREARRWNDWLARAAAGSANQMQVMYGVSGERLLHEWNIPWLSGFNGAKPVRVGNQASEQLQLDIYGELADALHQLRVSARERGGNFDLQTTLLEHLEKIWREPDHGIWEVRGEMRQFTHSKVMVWVAFDRTILSAERFGIKAPLARWRKIRREIHNEVCRLGFNRRIHSFVRSYGSTELDASLLLIPLVGFLPPQDLRVVGTVRKIEDTLMRDGLVMRYEPHTKREQSSADEGAFLPCSFWLADYYELAGRHEEAKRLLARLLNLRNDLGLLSEEFHTEKKRLVGNFPQALSHVALVNTVINIYSDFGPVHQRSRRHPEHERKN